MNQENMQEKQNVAYIYRVEKADFFIRHGHPIIGVGTGHTGRTFFMFEKNEDLLKTTEKYKETMKFIEKLKNN